MTLIVSPFYHCRILTVISHQVWQGDGLPEKMCDRCVTRAESALLYREQCRAADRALRQAALKVIFDLNIDNQFYTDN